MTGAILEITGISKSFGELKALDNVCCTFDEGEILGLIGPNGAGKTTLFNVISGFIKPDSGSIRLRGKDLAHLPPYKIAQAGVARTFQKIRIVTGLTVLENVLLAFGNQPGEKLSSVFFMPRVCARRESELQNKSMDLLKLVGIDGKASTSAANLSYGQQKLLNIACCLAAEASLILLDEPFAGVNQEMVKKIMALIKSLPLTGRSIVLIEHNMDAIMQVCERIIFMEAGRKVSEGKFEQVKNDSRVIEAYLK